MIDKFEGQYRFLSNFAPAEIFYHGVRFQTLEHAYQAAKAKTESDFWKFTRCGSPGEAKKLGRTIEVREDWEEIKVALMATLVAQKFGQRHFGSLLLATNPDKLVESNLWHDNFWGNCSCAKCLHIVGKNYLGKILMEVRRTYV